MSTPAIRIIGRLLPGVVLGAILTMTTAAAAARAADKQCPRVLFLTHSAGYEHAVIKRPSPHKLSYAAKKLRKMAGERFKVDVTKDVSKINARNLEQYEAVIFYTTGELPLDKQGRRALMQFIRSGGGFIGIHSATDTFFTWPAYGKMIGGYFNGHPWRQKVRILVEDASHPTTAHLGRAFTIHDEIYQFKNFSREDVHVLLRLDPEYEGIDLSKGAREDRYYAISWVKHWGAGRVFYTALGHRKQVWSDPRFQQHLVGGILWAMGMAAPAKTHTSRKNTSTSGHAP